MAGIACKVFTHERNTVPTVIKHIMELGEDKVQTNTLLNKYIIWNWNYQRKKILEEVAIQPHFHLWLAVAGSPGRFTGCLGNH